MKTISYNKFISKIVIITVLIIALLFFGYGFFIQSSSIKKNLTNENALFTDLIFQNLYTAMQNGANKSELDRVIEQVEKKITNSKVSLYRFKEETQKEYVIEAFDTKKQSLDMDGSKVQFAKPIYYEDTCLQCHNGAEVGNVAAIISLEFSLFDLRVSFKDILIMVTFLFIASIVVIFLIWYIYFSHVFIKPIKQLTNQMVDITEHKDLEKQITIDTPIDEVKVIEHVFNEQNQKLHFAYENLQSTSNIDSLTGVHNRKKFNEDMEEEIDNIKRYDYDMTLILLDLNKFKPINDTYGHDAGDAVLKGFAKLLSEHIRKTDKCYRIGGDEFVLTLSHTNAQNCIIVIEKLQSLFRENPVIHKENEFIISTSFGIAEYGTDGLTIESLLEVADKRMYEYKKSIHASR
jgi:diguanylate cyclase (GGDEF)-like protein